VKDIFFVVCSMYFAFKYWNYVLSYEDLVYATVYAPAVF